jgi:hypothetical protein
MFTEFIQRFLEYGEGLSQPGERAEGKEKIGQKTPLTKSDLLRICEWLFRPVPGLNRLSATARSAPGAKIRHQKGHKSLPFSAGTNSATHRPPCELLSTS